MLDFTDCPEELVTSQRPVMTHNKVKLMVFTGVGFHLGSHIQGLLGARLSLCHTPAVANMLKGLCSMVSTMIKKVECVNSVSGYV